jgi:hypothetical protein
MSQLIETLVRFYTIASTAPETEVAGIEQKLLELPTKDNSTFSYLP